MSFGSTNQAIFGPARALEKCIEKKSDSDLRDLLMCIEKSYLNILDPLRSNMNTTQQPLEKEVESVYITTLQTAFVIQYKISQVQELVELYRKSIIGPVPQLIEQSMHFVPRTGLFLLQQCLDYYKRKTVVIEF